MKNLQLVWLDNSDDPKVSLYDGADYKPSAQVDLTVTGGITICSQDPTALHALARVLDEAAVRLSAALDSRVAADMNARVA